MPVALKSQSKLKRFMEVWKLSCAHSVPTKLPQPTSQIRMLLGPLFCKEYGHFKEEGPGKTAGAPGASDGFSPVHKCAQLRSPGSLLINVPVPCSQALDGSLTA